MCAHNFTTLCDHMNDHDDRILDLGSDVKELFNTMTTLTKKCNHRASKLGLFLTITAGIVYVIKNEVDKKNLTDAVLKQGRREFGLEDEGEAIEPMGI